MAEPVSATSATGLFLKMYGAAFVVLIASMLCAMIVMLFRTPTNPKEWAAGLICTVISSLSGGSYIIVKFNMLEWLSHPFGAAAVGGIFFTCGLPGWWFVRAIFRFMDKRESKDAIELLIEANELRQGKLTKTQNHDDTPPSP